MELKITEEKENKLFNRKEVKGFVESNVTPSRPDVTKLLSEKFLVPFENIKIKKIMGKFGSKTFDAEANIYSSKEEKDSIELKKKKDIETEKKMKETEEAAKSVDSEKAAAIEKPAEEAQLQPEQRKEKTEQMEEEKTEEKSGEVQEKKENKSESQ